MNKGIIRNERGFTLIEIIAVLVILGILAAVAVPKYIDMQDEARSKAGQGAIAEIKARLSQNYAKLLLQNSTPPAAAAVNTATSNDVGADFNVTLTQTNNDVLIEVTKVQNTSVSNVNGTWTLPQ